MPSIHYKSSKLQSQIKQLAVESSKKQLPILQRSVQQVEARRAMATNVTLINNSLVKSTFTTMQMAKMLLSTVA